VIRPFHRYELDKWLGTSPWFTGTFLLLGIVAGFRNLFLTTQKRARRPSTRRTRKGNMTEEQNILIPER